MMTGTDHQSWIVAQLGARDHYAVSRSLKLFGALSSLVTDCWAPQKKLPYGASLAGRFHRGLQDVPVKSWTGRSLLFEAAHRMHGVAGWDLIVKRNAWFQNMAVEALKQLSLAHKESASTKAKVLFSYSYSSLAQARWAKAKGWTFVLGQIDPGPLDLFHFEPLEQQTASGSFSAQLRQRYEEDWRQECALADVIVVNSQWALTSIVRAGAPVEKVKVIPLAYEHQSVVERRQYPSEYTNLRPMKVLFLGNLNRRKGGMEILDAARKCLGLPVQFVLVGNAQPELRTDAASIPNVKMIGAVPRAQVGEWYEQADVFLFPTHSDGFGITQLEALSHSLPVIASRHCGDVITDGVNGIRLSEVTGDAISLAVRRLLITPGVLEDLSRNCRIDRRYSLASLGQQLLHSVRAN